MEARLFFEFLQVAIGNRESLSRELSDNEWQDIFLLIKKHALLGVGFTAVERLHTKGIVCPAELRIKWYALAVHIERRNRLLNGLCKKVTEQYEHDGFSTCILKGQGNILNYPKELGTRRQSGDIDVWATPIKYLIHTENTEGHGCLQGDGVGERLSITDDRLFTHNIFSAVFIKLRKFLITDGLHTENTDGYGGPQADGGIKIAVQTGKNEVEYEEYHGHKAVREYVRMQYRLQGLNTKPKACYHHIDAPDMDGVKVEVHYRPTFCRSFVRNRRMQKWFDTLASECMSNRISEGFSVPTASFNVVYQMAHLFEHYFEGGIGLRHIMDYYFALKAWQKDIMEWNSQQSQGMWSEGLGTPVMSPSQVMDVIRSFGMGKFAGAVMFVINEVFGGANENENDNENGPRRTRRETDGGPQADFVGKQGLMNDDRLLITDCPWLLCEPNEKEGRRLLEEIMKGGNFGQYDTRDAALKKGGMMKHGVWKLKRVMRLVRSYPEEALWEPVFRVYHLIWRMKMR